MGPYRACWRLAGPLILSNLTVPLLGIVDTAVVGHLPEPHHLGAVAIGALVLSVVYFVLGFLRMGTTGLAAQAFGAGDGDELRAGLARALILAVGLALLLLALAGPIGAVSLRAFAPSPRVAEQFLVYLELRLVGAPAALANLVLLGWLLGLQNARGPLALMVVTNGLNILLDLVLVLGLGMGVRGVALATVLSEYAGLGLGLALARRALGRIGGRLGRGRLLAAAPFRRLVAVNRDILLRSLCLQAAFAGFTALGARQGELVLAANAVLFNFQHLAAYGLDGFAHAAEALVGRHVGARDGPAFRQAVRAALVWSLGLAATVALAFALLGRPAIAVMTGQEAVRAAAATFLPYLVASPPVSALAFLFDGVFIGATRTAEMRNGMFLALLTFVAGAALLVPPFGNHGLWLAFLLFMGFRGLWLGAAYLRLERRAAFVPA